LLAKSLTLASTTIAIAEINLAAATERFRGVAWSSRHFTELGIQVLETCFLVAEVLPVMRIFWRKALV